MKAPNSTRTSLSSSSSSPSSSRTIQSNSQPEEDLLMNEKFNKSLRDKLLQQKLWNLIQAHIDSLEEENTELKRSLQRKETEQKLLKKRIQVWEQKVRTWYEQRNKRRSIPPPPSLDHMPSHNNHDNHDGDANKNRHPVQRKKMEMGSQVSKGHDVRSIVASATKTLHQKKRKKSIESSKVVYGQDIPHVIKFPENDDDGDDDENKFKPIEPNEKETKTPQIDSNENSDNFWERKDDAQGAKQAISPQLDIEKESNATSGTRQTSVTSNNSTSEESPNDDGNDDGDYDDGDKEIQHYTRLGKGHQNLKRKHRVIGNDRKKNSQAHPSLTSTTSHSNPNKIKDNPYSTKSKNTYKYKEVIRNRAERRALPGHSCPECKAFIDAVCYNNAGDRFDGVFDRKFLVQECSRHRGRFSPDPPTPDGFWDLSFADSVKAREDQLDFDNIS